MTDIKLSGLVAQARLSIGGQHITSIISARCGEGEVRLKRGQMTIALIQSIEVMIVKFDWIRLTVTIPFA